MSDNTLHEEIAIEQQHVDRVYARLAGLRAEAAQAEADGYQLARVGNYGALVERDAMVFHAARRRHTFDAEHEGLVFGRLDLHPNQLEGFDAETDPEAAGWEKRPRYIGRLGVRTEHAEPLLIDWRAPAAAAFYRATAAQPLGVIRRRMISSFGEKVTGIEDDLLDPANAPEHMTIIGDGALLAALSRAKGTGMRDIVATIQHEQDLAIRSPASGVTLVEGGPGTGKTAVALHRAAYLLYADRARFAGGGVLIVGPSPVFVEYIETVLPALGEDSATLKSTGQLVVGVNATREETSAVRAVKGSLRMRRVLRRAAEDAPPSDPDGLRVRYRGEWLVLTRQQTEDIRRRVGRGNRRNEIRAKAFGAVLDQLWAQARSKLARLDQSKFDEELTEHEGFRTFLKAWWPIVSPVQVLGWLADPKRLRRYADGTLSGEEQRLLTRALAPLREQGPSIDDVPLLDELLELVGTQPVPKRRRREAYTVGGVREVATAYERARASLAADPRARDYRDYAHVVVDEAQDVTPMQWRMIGRRGHAASWTIVGDPAQTAWTGDPREPGRARDEALGGRKRHPHRLTTNYRNSTEIFEVAAEVIRQVSPDLPLPRAVRSTGVAPVHRVVEPSALERAVREAVAGQLGEVEGTVGVITADARVRAEVRGWLAEHEQDRLRVVTALEAKGMEYDAVVLVEPAAITGGTDAGRRTLYVALSRATQRLVTVASRPWRPPARAGHSA
ncbi:DNA helicase [Catellatospora sp. TT07R-123]|uniref:HelD family protein n=1 Tax=Catellatospora sp. TT07R-123 TaxID=2733863 RepID=UPI001B2CB96B|nr:ATP-binding domain-containing protein [Catellatospora sp. TT07R-123]GHJ45155.1 DNA helicase [Catellatospora sp. TT07R-123]